MVGRLLSFWDGFLVGAMLVRGRVSHVHEPSCTIIIRSFGIFWALRDDCCFDVAKQKRMPNFRVFHGIISEFSSRLHWERTTDISGILAVWQGMVNGCSCIQAKIIAQIKRINDWYTRMMNDWFVRIISQRFIYLDDQWWVYIWNMFEQWILDILIIKAYGIWFIQFRQLLQTGSPTMHNFPQAFMTVRVPAIQRIREKDVQLLLELPEALKRRQPAETHLTAWSRCLTNELNRWNLCVMFDFLKQTWRLSSSSFWVCIWNMQLPKVVPNSHRNFTQVT